MAEDLQQGGGADPELESQFAEALAAAEAEPENDELWDIAEDFAEELQRPDEVGAAYRQVLAQDLSRDLTETLGRRAVGFHEEWFAEDSPHLQAVLLRILELDPAADWALQQITVLLTDMERWGELLGLYDRSIAAATNDGRREQLLEEASSLAKDFAGEPDRAIDYLSQLRQLRPSDARLASSLERLLERQSRWEELISLWRSRISDPSAQEAIALRGRIAVCYLENLNDPAATLSEVGALLADHGGDASHYELLERIVALESTDPDTRRGALELLRSHYESSGRAEDVIRVVGVALAFSEGPERVGLHRELGGRLSDQGNHLEAMSQWASVLSLEPSAEDAQDCLRDLAETAGAFDRYADALTAAAEATGQVQRRNALIVEAADVRARRLGDQDAAITMLQGVLAGDAGTSTRLSVGRRLEGLLHDAERFEERLTVLEGLAAAETDEAERRRVLGQCARLAERLEQGDRALGFWQQRLEGDEGDLEALEALVGLTARLERWDYLVDALRRRVAADVPDIQRRIDLGRIAETQAERLGLVDEAITTWDRIREEFGEDHDTVDAMFALCVRAGRYEQIHELLDRAAARDAERAAEVLARVADICREHLEQPDAAARAYHRAILMVPDLERAQAGLGQLVEVPEARASAVRGLAKAFELTDAWEKQLGLLEQRLELAPGDDERVELLREAARLQEERAGSPAEALEANRRALGIAPGSSELEGEVLRLAEETGAWGPAVESIATAARALAETRRGRAEQLFRREAELRENRVEDVEGALTAWTSALSLAPHDLDVAQHAIRLGAGVGNWDSAAGAAMTVSLARGGLQHSLFDDLESRAEGAGAFGELAAALASATPTPGDIDASSGREVEGRVARLFSGHVGDPAQAEAALVRALAHDGGHAETLRELARLRWAEPGTPLVDTLLEIAGHFPDDLDPLYDAARISLDPVGDVELAGGILGRLLRNARRLWEGASEATGERAAAETAVWALDQLVALAIDRGDTAAAVDLLVSGARMPVAPERSRSMRTRAGELCREQLGDEDRALRLLQGVIDESADDPEAVEQLAVLLEGRQRFPELLALRQRQLELDVADDVRLGVRLEVARVLGLIEAQAGRVGVLTQNLEDLPGHVASVEALAEILAGRGRFEALAELYRSQATAVEEQGEAGRAAGLWARAAERLEVDLGDIAGALRAHRRVVALEPSTVALDALARLHMGRDEPGVAAEWLTRRFEGASPEESNAIALRLADAHIAAESHDSAMGVLENLLDADPSEASARERLAKLYRGADAWSKLAQLLSDGARHETDRDARLAQVREAAHLYEERLDQPDRAIPVLQMGVELEPNDNELRSKLALGLRVAGRLDEAREILEELATAYGRRRSPERAAVHFQLAQVAHAAADLPEAMKQLEKARKMDMSHPGILRMAGRLAQEAGQLEKAEKSYRALLLVVRRQDPTSPEVTVGASEVLYELSLLATAQEDSAQAQELLETALSTASEHDEETDRFKRDLVARGEFDLALKAVEQRLAAVTSDESRATVLAHRADVLATHLDRTAEGLDAILEAVALAPREPALHEQARSLASRLEQTSRYTDALSALVKQYRRQEDAAVRSEFLLRLGSVFEQDQQDLDQASQVYAQVEELGVDQVSAWLALARVADAQGDGPEEVRVLRALIDAESAVPSEARTRALYRIAEVELGSGALEGGMVTLRHALDREPRYSRAGAILQATVETSAENSLLQMYDEVARASGDPAMILDFLERRSQQPDATIEMIREGVERADAIDAPARAEALLSRGLVVAQEAGLAPYETLWIPTSLAERRQAAGDIPGAIDHTRTALELADGEEARALQQQLASLASQEGGDLELAAQTYRQLLADDPSNRGLWEPLAGVYASLGAREELNAVVASTLDALLEPGERNELRMFYAGFLIEKAEDDEAVTVLGEVLDEDPDHLEAAQRLADLHQKRGDRAGLVELLERQLDRARDRQDVDAIVDLSMRMGALVEADDDVIAAVEFYRAGLDWAPESPALLAALLNHIHADAAPRDRAELMERLLAVSCGPEAADLANQLIALWTELDDPYGAGRALELGFRACPGDETLRRRLEERYRAGEEWQELAQMIAYDSLHREDALESVARARDAGRIFREQLDNPAAAAETLRAAWLKAPTDLVLLGELVGDLAAAGLHAAAAEDVAVALEGHLEASRERAQLLRMRGRLELHVGNAYPAVTDLEEAYGIDPSESAQDLVTGLDALRYAAAEAGDPEGEQAATHRLALILTESGNAEGGREVLAEWVERSPGDVSAVRRLREIDTAAERWDSVASHNALLIEVEQGEEQVLAALGLSDACERISQPEAARPGLEQVLRDQPGETRIREALRRLYEVTEAHAELAKMLTEDARAAEDADSRFELLRQVGDLLISKVGDPEAALEPLAEAAALKPEEHELVLLLADAYLGSERFHEAVELLSESINNFKRRRSPHLAGMQLRMARIAGMSGDSETQKEWLSVALDADKNNGEVASELAELAIELGDDDTALKALRVVTLQKTPGPMSKAVAFLRQAQIAHRQGEASKAVLWARRARLEDEDLAEAHEFLAEIGES